MPIITVLNLRLKLVPLFNFLFIFIIASSQTLANNNIKTVHQKDKIEVKEFNNYKLITLKNQILMVGKLKPYMAYTNNLSHTYHYLDFNNLNSHQVSAYGKNGLHTVYKDQKNKKIKYSFVQKNTHYFCDPLTKDAIERLTSDDFLDKVTSDQLISAIDTNKCNSDQQEVLTKQFKKSNKILSLCLDPNNQNSPLIKDPGYEHAIKGMTLSFESFIKSASEAKSPLNITCDKKENLKEKLGQLNEKINPPTISINFEKIENDLAAKDDLNKDILMSANLSKVLSHELTHFYQKTDYQSLSDKFCNLPKCEKKDIDSKKTDCISEEHSKYCQLPESDRKLSNENNLCINESFTNEIMNVCYSSEDSSNLKIQKSSDLIFSCVKSLQSFSELSTLDQKNNNLNAGGDSKSDTSNKELKIKDAESKSRTVAGSDNNQENQKAEENAKTKNNNQNTISTALNTGANKVTDNDFKTVSSDTYATLQGPTPNNPNPSYGKAYEVSATSSYGKAVTEAMSAFQKTETNVVPKLNAAIAATTTTAQATGSTLATTTGSTTSSSASSRSPASDASTTTEKIAATTATTQQTANKPSNQNSELSNGTGSVTTASSNITSDTAANNSTLNKIANSNNSSGVSTMSAEGNPNAAATVTSNGGASAAGAISQGAISSAPNTNTRSPASLPPATNNMGKSIQALKAFSSVSGPQYQEVRSNYENPEFDEALEKQDIRILVKSEKGQYLVLGSRSQKTQRVFVDDEKLKSIKILNDNRK